MTPLLAPLIVAHVLEDPGLLSALALRLLPGFRDVLGAPLGTLQPHRLSVSLLRLVWKSGGIPIHGGPRGGLYNYSLLLYLPKGQCGRPCRLPTCVESFLVAGEKVRQVLAWFQKQAGPPVSGRMSKPWWWPSPIMGVAWTKQPVLWLIMPPLLCSELSVGVCWTRPGAPVRYGWMT